MEETRRRQLPTEAKAHSSEREETATDGNTQMGIWQTYKTEITSTNSLGIQARTNGQKFRQNQAQKVAKNMEKFPKFWGYFLTSPNARRQKYPPPSTNFHFCTPGGGVQKIFP